MGKQRDSHWRRRQDSDPYVRAARRAGWRSRAAFKLEQIDKKERLLRPDMLCIDLGAAPGSWSQYVVERLKGRVRVVALDLLAMDALPGVEVIQGDFRESETLTALLEALDGEKADLVMSDMAPNLSGTKAIDQPRALHLAELTVDLAERTLARGGDLLCKVFHGAGTETFIAETRDRFERLRIVKPAASRPGSSEVYLVARNYRL